MAARLGLAFERRDGIRWMQRFDNFQRALQALERGVGLSQSRELSELEQQGLIQGFEFTHELAWNVVIDYLKQQGIQDLVGSRDATRQAFRNGLIEDGETWMEMIRARNQTSHTYNLEVAQAIAADVTQRFQRLRNQPAPWPAAEGPRGPPESGAGNLYGSRAMGSFQAGSDIDLTLSGPGLSPGCLARIETDLDDLLLPWMIDLCTWASINHPPLLDHIQRVGIVLFERNSQHGHTSHDAT